MKNMKFDLAKYTGAFSRNVGGYSKALELLRHEEEFHASMKALHVDGYSKDAHKLVDKLRLMFQSLPHKYVGDQEVYRMFKSGILAGFDVKETAKKVNEIIEREHEHVKMFIAAGVPYCFNFNNINSYTSS